MKALPALSIVAAVAVAPVFAGGACVAPLSDVRIPNGNKATMDEIVAANYALQENTNEVAAYLHCLKAEQEVRIAAMGPDATDDQKSKVASEYANHVSAENEKLQNLADRYSEAVRSFRAKQAAVKSAEETNDEEAAVRTAEQDAAEKARHDAIAQKAEDATEKPHVPKGH